MQWNVEHLDHVDSTNTWLARQAREGADGRRAVYCDYQSDGRGRLDRAWHAPARSSLLCSALLSPPPTTVAPQWIVIAAALAACDALHALSGVRPSLKWPNDVLYAEQKVGGLLAELVTPAAPARRPVVVVGLGLNLSAVDPDFVTATTVRAATGVALEPVAILSAYLEALDERRPLLDVVAGRRTLRAQYLADLSTIDRDVRVELVGEVVRGRAVGIDEDAALIVDVGGERRSFAAGDVVHVRGEDG